MNATITRIETNRPYITVTVRGREYGLDLYHRPNLAQEARVGQTIRVKRVVNNPFLIPVN